MYFEDKQACGLLNIICSQSESEAIGNNAPWKHLSFPGVGLLDRSPDKSGKNV